MKALSIERSTRPPGGGACRKTGTNHDEHTAWGHHGK